jgi:chromosome segregation ATPase
MSNDKIEEILARHELDAMMTALHLHPDLHWTNAQTGLMAHVDRAFLLAEVERLTRQRDEARAEVERLRADLAVQQGCCDGAAAQDAHIRQEREEHRAEIERLRADNERLRENVDRLGKEVERLRAALEGKS